MARFGRANTFISAKEQAMEKFIFKPGSWDKSKLTHVYSAVAKTFVPFTEEDDCIVSGYNPEIDYYDYISLSDRKEHHAGCRIRTRCSFDSFGAPLIVLTNEIFEDQHGYRYGLNYEVVVWEGGCNVWRVETAPPESGRAFFSIPVLQFKFPIAEKSVVDLEVESVGNKLIEVKVNNMAFALRLEDLNDTFYVGIAGCEGVNRFYELEIES